LEGDSELDHSAAFRRYPSCCRDPKQKVSTIFLIDYSSDNEFYKHTIQDLLERLNSFMWNHIDQLRALIPDYIDTIALFISNINEVRTHKLKLIETHSSSGDNSVQVFHTSDWKKSVAKSMELLCYLAAELVRSYSTCESY
jgi:hypothetical protein